MEFTYPQTKDGILALLNDLAGPWEEPLSFAGFATPFQKEISQFSEMSDAIAAVDIALSQWASAATPNVVLNVLADIAATPSDDDAHNHNKMQRKASWEQAIGMLIYALEEAHPQETNRLIDSEHFSGLRHYLNG
ncbi:MAG: hypothetical protein AAFU53_00325 [Cyanobacteria bacterium J06632_3]